MDETWEPTVRRWLLFIYRIPSEPPGPRTYVWRQLKGLGATYLQQAAALLPDRPDLREALNVLATRVIASGGEASLLDTTSPDPAWEAEAIARFNQARDAEYAELFENVERLEDEIARESRRGKFSFAKLEDLEADWEKLTRWRERIVARDFFGAGGRRDVDTEMACARAAPDRFTVDVLAQADSDSEGDRPVSLAKTSENPG